VAGALPAAGRFTVETVVEIFPEGNHQVGLGRVLVSEKRYRFSA
jgi:hypothetical protein